MLLKSIKLENIRSYVDEKIDFPAGSILLAGDIGSGKSSVLLSTEFALFGIQRGELSGTDLLRHGANSGTIELCLELDGKDIVICRNLKRDKKGVTQDTGYVEINGVRNHKTASELRAFVIELLGYPQEYMTKNPLIFRYTVYTPQDEMKRILFAPHDERLNILRKIFDIDKYGRIRDNTTNIVMKDLRALKRELEVQFSDTEQKTKEKEEKKRTLDETSARLISEKKSLLLLENQIVEKESEAERLSKQLKEISKIMQTMASSKTLLEQKKKRIQIISQELNDLEKRISSLEAFLDKEIRRPDADERELQEIKMKKEKERQEATLQRGVLENEIKRFREILMKGICEFCGQNVSDPSSFKSKIDEKASLLKQVLETISSANKEIEKLEELRKLYTEYLYELRMKAEKQKDFSDTLQKKASFNVEMQSLISEIEKIEQDIEVLGKDVSLLSEIETKESRLKIELSTLRRNKDNVSQTVAKLESQIESLVKEIKNIEKQISEKQKMKEKFNRVSELLSWFDLTFLPLMESMEKHVLSAIQQEFNEFFQSWFSVLIPDENISVKVDEQFSSIIEQAGYQTEYQNLSGGEKTSVALAYRLALNKVINSLVETIKTKDLIILDEPTDGFSMDQLDRIRDVLNELNLKQMIIVSHEPKIDTYVDNVIRFYKEGHISRVAR